MATMLSRVLAEVAEVGPNECLPWPGEIGRGGYGRAWTGPKQRAMAHRAVYQAIVGPVPDGLQLDHLCRNPACVNPSHLEPVTPAINVRRARRIPGEGPVPDACVNGHPYTDANTYVGKKGFYCRTCNRAAAAALYRRKKLI